MNLNMYKRRRYFCRIFTFYFVYNFDYGISLMIISDDIKMKKFLKNKRKISESSDCEDADDPGVFTPSPVRGGGVIAFSGQPLSGCDGVAGSRSAGLTHEEEGYHGSYSTEMGFQGLSIKMSPFSLMQF